MDYRATILKNNTDQSKSPIFTNKADAEAWAAEALETKAGKPGRFTAEVRTRPEGKKLFKLCW